MITTTASFSVAVSSPGGVARQYRVQYRHGLDRDWRMYATFRTPEQAEDCEKQLQEKDYETRVVAYALCPTAL